MKSKLIIYLVIILILGISTKFYQGWQSDWVNSKLGGVFYVLFWMVLLHLFFPQFALWKNALLVFLVTSVIEISQLWNPPILIFIRRSFIGRTLFGTTFSASDFIYYFGGVVLGFGLLNLAKGKS